MVELDMFADELGMTVEEIVGFARARYLDDANTGPAPDLDFDTVVAVREDLDQYCVRTVPSFWWPGTDPEAGNGATKMRWVRRGATATRWRRIQGSSTLTRSR